MKFKSKDIRSLEKARQALLRAMHDDLPHAKETDTVIVFAALIELTMDVAILICQNNESRALQMVSDSINLLMTRRHDK